MCNKSKIFCQKFLLLPMNANIPGSRVIVRLAVQICCLGFTLTANGHHCRGNSTFYRQDTLLPGTHFLRCNTIFLDSTFVSAVARSYSLTTRIAQCTYTLS